MWYIKENFMRKPMEQITESSKSNKNNNLFFLPINISAAATIGLATFFSTQGKIIPAISVFGISRLSSFGISTISNKKIKELETEINNFAGYLKPTFLVSFY